MVISRGFRAHRRGDESLPPGQYLVRDFPVLSAGPTPRVPTESWRFTVTTETGAETSWNWAQFLALPQEDVTVDLHCVTKWSKLGTAWRGVSLDTLLAGVGSGAKHALVSSYGGYTTNLPVADLLDGRAWLAHRYDGRDLEPVHGGPVRLLVPHLYLWKSAKWVRALRLMPQEELGFWESLGYHPYGDPWREQRYAGD